MQHQNSAEMMAVFKRLAEQHQKREEAKRDQFSLETYLSEAKADVRRMNTLPAGEKRLYGYYAQPDSMELNYDGATG